MKTNKVKTIFGIVVERSFSHLRVAIVKNNPDKIMASNIVLDLEHAVEIVDDEVVLDPLVSEIIENRYLISLPFFKEVVFLNDGKVHTVDFDVSRMKYPDNWYIFNERNRVHTEIQTPYHYEVARGKGWDLFYFDTLDAATKSAKGKKLIVSPLVDLIREHHQVKQWIGANKCIREEAKEDFPHFYRTDIKEK